MIKLTSFRAALLSRLVAGLGAASAIATSGCGDAAQPTGGGGASSTGSGGAGGATTSAVTSSGSGATTSGSTSTSGAGGSGSSSSSTGTGMANVERCFSIAGGAPCPDLAAAQGAFGSCTSMNELVTMWLSGPTTMGTNCCYQVDVTAPDAPICVPIPGRPFMVEGQARVAPVRAGLRGWEERPTTSARASAAFSAPSPCIAELDEATRAQLGRAWATDAAFEHASIGSFGKLALELLSFGAPADLVRAAHEAALDEIGHAQQCFALASGYLGAAVGPGALVEARSFTGASTLADLAIAAVHEGCFGETIAAVVASAQLADATDPAVREVLAIVAEEESRHAELSFRIVAWAIGAGGDAVRTAVHGAFLEALTEIRRAAQLGAPEATSTSLRAHGRLSTTEMLAERLRGAEEVVVPAMGLLLGAQA
jgi:hypothetical protein